VLLTLAADRQSTEVHTVLAGAGRTGETCCSVAGSTFWRIA
jgi:hypothetical protein